MCGELRIKGGEKSWRAKGNRRREIGKSGKPPWLIRRKGVDGSANGAKVLRKPFLAIRSVT